MRTPPPRNPARNMNPTAKPSWKLHRPVAKAVLECLYEAFAEGRQIDKCIEKRLKNRSLGARDRKFLAETTYEMTRWWRLIWRCSGMDEPSAENLNEGSLWHLLGTHFCLRDFTLPPWPEFNILEKAKIIHRMESVQNHRALRESIPDWLDDLGEAEMPKWDEAIKALNKKAPVILRANTLKTTPGELQKILAEDEIYTDQLAVAPSALKLKERRNVFQSKAFKLGLFEMQDGASQKVAPLLQAQPGERVIDACAGAGGKTLHLAALMQNKGKIIALDIYEKKLIELKRRAARAGVDNVEAKLIDGAKTIKRLAGSADRVLLDVPCSGMGVLRRNPDTKWKLRPEDISELNQLQKQILNDYSEMVRVGGYLVYATCSCLPSENEKQVQAFLATHSNWKLEDEMNNFPGKDDFDGFYGARLKRVKE